MINKINICILGDIYIISNIYGEINRISPEAPVPILNISKTNNNLSGTYKYASILNHMSIESKIFSIIGDDFDSEFITKTLVKQNLKSNLLVHPNFSTFKKSKIQTNLQHVLQIDTIDEIANEIYEKFYNNFELCFNDFDIFLLIDHDLGTLKNKSKFIKFLHKKNKLYFEKFDELKIYLT